jgi:hypothetical protein
LRRECLVLLVRELVADARGSGFVACELPQVRAVVQKLLIELLERCGGLLIGDDEFLAAFLASPFLRSVDFLEPRLVLDDGRFIFRAGLERLREVLFDGRALFLESRDFVGSALLDGLALFS